ncbi:MAG: myo-inosose-2 dehydratase [Paracoccaceae bacterium]
MAVHQNTGNFAQAVKLGVSPLSWVNEIMEDFGRDTSAQTILSQAKSSGFEGVEMSRAFPREANALKAILKNDDLSLISGWFGGFLAEGTVEDALKAVTPHASILKSCGCEVMVYGECGHMAEDALDIPLSERLTLSGDEMVAYGDRLTRFADALYDRFGLKFAYHHHLMMVAETLEEVRAVMANTGHSVGLLLDTGHAEAGGFDYAHLITEFGSRITHIHLKDVRANVMKLVRADGISFNDGVRMGMFTIPGDGSVDFGPLAEFLAKGTYSGWLVVEAEQDPTKAPPAETAARAHRFVSETILKTVLACTAT